MISLSRRCPPCLGLNSNHTGHWAPAAPAGQIVLFLGTFFSHNEDIFDIQNSEIFFSKFLASQIAVCAEISRFLFTALYSSLDKRGYGVSIQDFASAMIVMRRCGVIVGNN
jgi:hypothetical protein